MDKLCGILDIRNKCTDVLDEMIHMCQGACEKSGMNPRALMGDSCVNYHPINNSRYSCADILSLQTMMTFPDKNVEKCTKIINDESEIIDNKLHCLHMFDVVSKKYVTNINDTVSSDELNIVKKVASDGSF